MNSRRSIEAKQREREMQRSTANEKYFRCITSCEEAQQLYHPGISYPASIVKRDISTGDAKPEWFREEN